MAVTRNSRSIIMTAAADAVVGKIFVQSIQFIGTGLTLAQRLTLTETSGAVLADHYVEAVNETFDLVNVPQWFDGIIASAVPAGGTFTIVIRYR